jgi:uncharacterized RDD family membrane protein YckC
MPAASRLTAIIITYNGPAVLKGQTMADVILDYAERQERGLIPATPAARVVAGVHTLCVMGVPGVLLLLMLRRMGLQWQAVLLCAGTISVICTLIDAAARRGTIGMRMVSLRIARRDGGAIGFWWCAARIATGMLLLPLLPVSAVMAYLDRRHRTLADRICETVVWAQPRPLPHRRGFEFGPLEERKHL